MLVSRRYAGKVQGPRASGQPTGEHTPAGHVPLPPMVRPAPGGHPTLVPPAGILRVRCVSLPGDRASRPYYTIFLADYNQDCGQGYPCPLLWGYYTK